MLSKLKISHRIGLAIAVPLMGILVMLVFEVSKSFTEYYETSFLSEVGDAVAELGEMSHRIQIERGQTAAYLAQGGNPPEELVSARAHVDEEVGHIHSLIEHLKGRAGAGLIHEFEQIEEQVKELSGFRDRIDAGSVSGAESLQHYSKVVHHIIEIGFHASGLASDGGIARQIVAFVNLSEAKEFAGQERGLINGVLAAESMTQDQLVFQKQLVANQDLLEEAFIQNETEEHRATYEALLEGTGKEELNGLRERIAASWNNIPAAKLDAAEWFEASTAHIEALRSIEKKVAVDIHTDAEALADEALQSMVFSGLLGGVILALAIAAGYVMARSITSPLGQLTGGMEKISSGEIDTEVLGRDRRDEIGSMARALQSFKDGSAEKAMLEREAEKTRAENERAREERESEKAAREAETSRAVSALAGALEELSRGDLTVSIETPFVGELEKVRVDFNASIGTLCSTFREIKTNIDAVFSDASEMRSAADSLSERTEKQAASLEETSASLEELAATVKSSSQSAGQASEKAAEAKKNSDNSSTVVADAVNAMTQIESGSQEIAQIIGLIDEIAFQTNLLALNAGVEAARAGDAGKGFAVVAQEVRELAQRSASAAKDIKDLISKSSTEVESGVRFVRETGKALEAIAADVTIVNEMIESIADAAKEQSVGLGECTTAVSQLDQFTQHNAAMVEETTATTHRLSTEAETLSRLVNQFKLEHSGAGIREQAESIAA